METFKTGTVATITFNHPHIFALQRANPDTISVSTKIPKSMPHLAALFLQRGWTRLEAKVKLKVAVWPKRHFKPGSPKRKHR